jgi:hypothetical protein
MLNNDPNKRPKDIDTIKSDLIAHRNTFVSQQKLRQLEKTIVPKYESEDPLINNPVKIASVDYSNGMLFLKLSPKANSSWIGIYHSMSEFSYSSTCHPKLFNVTTDQADVRVAEEDVQETVNFFKGYLDRANQDYKNYVQNNLQEQERAERKRLEAEIENEKIRQRVIGNLKI